MQHFIKTAWGLIGFEREQWRWDERVQGVLQQELDGMSPHAASDALQQLIDLWSDLVGKPEALAAGTGLIGFIFEASARLGVKLELERKLGANQSAVVREFVKNYGQPDTGGQKLWDVLANR